MWNTDTGIKVQITWLASHGSEQNYTTLSDVYNVADYGEQWDSSFQLSKDGGRQPDTAAHQ